jgi:hypothetical protein
VLGPRGGGEADRQYVKTQNFDPASHQAVEPTPGSIFTTGGDLPVFRLVADMKRSSHHFSYMHNHSLTKSY